MLLATSDRHQRHVRFGVLLAYGVNEDVHSDGAHGDVPVWWSRQEQSAAS